MSQYDAIAKQYADVRSIDFYKVYEATVLSRIGHVQGKTVLDLACGYGYYSRLLKRIGASKVLGVDNSHEMITLAKIQEEKEPLGIEYICKPIQEISKIGTFGYALSVFLLHYAQDKHEIREMCSAVFQNLKPGARFLNFVDDGEKAIEFSSRNTDSYNMWYSVLSKQSPQERDKINFKIKSDQTWVEFEYFIHSRETYEQGLKLAGFTNIVWHPMVLPQELKEVKIWHEFVQYAPSVLVECVRE